MVFVLVRLQQPLYTVADQRCDWRSGDSPGVQASHPPTAPSRTTGWLYCVHLASWLSLSMPLRVKAWCIAALDLAESFGCGTSKHEPGRVHVLRAAALSLQTFPPPSSHFSVAACIAQSFAVPRPVVSTAPTLRVTGTAPMRRHKLFHSSLRAKVSSKLFL